MPSLLYETDAGKTSANLSINKDLLRQAKEHKINLSRALESKLKEILREEKRLQWRENNQEAIAEYNERINKNGVFSNGLRMF